MRSQSWQPLCVYRMARGAGAAAANLATIAAVLIQTALGIATIVYGVPVAIALARRANGILLLTLALWALHRAISPGGFNSREVTWGRATIGGLTKLRSFFRTQRLAIARQKASAGCIEEGIAGSGVPFGGLSEARIDIRVAPWAIMAAELERGAQAEAAAGRRAFEGSFRSRASSATG